MSYTSCHEDILKRFNQESFSDAFVQQAKDKLSAYRCIQVIVDRRLADDVIDPENARRTRLNQLLHRLYQEIESLFPTIDAVLASVTFFNRVKDLGKLIRRAFVIFQDVDRTGLQDFNYVASMINFFLEKIEPEIDRLKMTRNAINEIRHKLDALDKENLYTKFLIETEPEIIASQLSSQFEDLIGVVHGINSELDNLT